MAQDEMDKQSLIVRLAAHGLKVPDSDLEALLPAIGDLEVASQTLRRDRPFDLEPLSAFSLVNSNI